MKTMCDQVIILITNVSKSCSIKLCGFSNLGKLGIWHSTIPATDRQQYAIVIDWHQCQKKHKRGTWWG